LKKILENLLRSQMHAQFHETLLGRVTIRAFHMLDNISSKTLKMIEHQMEGKHQASFIVYWYFG
jgi:hypothetical protein